LQRVDLGIPLAGPRVGVEHVKIDRVAHHPHRC
jgi:hypothetical protein